MPVGEASNPNDTFVLYGVDEATDGHVAPDAVVDTPGIVPGWSCQGD